MTRTTARYSPKSAQAIGFLKSNVNDVDIYVEDTSNPNMWVHMLQSFLPDTIQLDSVTVLGGRENVLAACKADQKTGGRPRLYIIDSDFDILQGVRKPNLLHLYRLRAYCVENYLLQEQALAFSATVYDTKITQSDALTKINFEGWLQRNDQSISKLFVCYAVANKLEKSITTIGRKVHQLIDKNSENFDLCPKATSMRIISIYRELLGKHSLVEIRLEYEKIKKNSKKYNSRMFVSGKDYIFPSICKLIKKIFKVSAADQSIKVLLASKVRSEIDPYLKKRLKKICN